MPESSSISALDKAVDALRPITLEEMDSVKLLNRIDSKYLTNEAGLVSVLQDAAAAGYRAQVEYIVWFFILLRLIDDEKDAKAVALVFCAVVFLLALHGIYQ